MTMLTPARRAHLSMIGRIGGHATAAVVDTKARAKLGQTAFRDTFVDGHECNVCPAVTIPKDLWADERERRAEQLYRNHFRRIRLRAA